VFQALLDAFDKPDVSITEMKQIYGKLRRFGAELQTTYRGAIFFSECVPTFGNSGGEIKSRLKPVT